MTSFANEYGDGLYALAREEHISERILGEAETLDSCFGANPGFVKLLDNRTIPLAEREGVIRDTFDGRVHAYLLNFLMLLCRRGGIREYSACVKRFRDDYYRDNNIALASATTASALTEEQREKLRSTLSRMTGKQIILTERVDPLLLGGVRVDVDGRRIDNTIKARMEQLRLALRADA